MGGRGAAFYVKRFIKNNAEKVVTKGDLIGQHFNSKGKDYQYIGIVEDGLLIQQNTRGSIGLPSKVSIPNQTLILPSARERIYIGGYDANGAIKEHVDIGQTHVNRYPDGTYDVFDKAFVHIQHLQSGHPEYAWDLNDAELGRYRKTIEKMGGKVREKNRILPEERQSRINRV